MPARKHVRSAFIESEWKPVLNEIEKSRLRRGKGAAKQGDVVSLTIEDGQVVANVRSNGVGAGLYRVQFPCVDNWTSSLNQIAAWLANRLDVFAAILAGEWDESFLTFLQETNLRLFPDAEAALRIKAEAACTCQDWEPICQHIVCVIYKIIFETESNPFQALACVGICEESLLDAVHMFSARAMHSNRELDMVSGASNSYIPNTFTETGNVLWAEEECAIEQTERIECVLRHQFAPVYRPQVVEQLKMRFRAWP